MRAKKMKNGIKKEGINSITVAELKKAPHKKV